MQDFLFGKFLDEKLRENERFVNKLTQIHICGKVVNAMCNTSWTFVHFSLALDSSIRDNPARS